LIPPAEEHYASGGQDTSNYKFSQENGIAFACSLYDAKANGQTKWTGVNG